LSHVFSLKMARQTAEAFLKEESIASLPVDPFAIAESRDIMVEGKPEKAEGVSGMLLRHGNSFGIVYATHIPSPGFQRFSVSHELGHYFLPGHVDHILPKGAVHVSRAGFITSDPYELEADNFAAGLLMPEAPFKRAIDQYDPGLDAIEAVADLCQTSRTATAIRFAELTDAAVAVIMSTGSQIDYCFLSRLTRIFASGSFPIPHSHDAVIFSTRGATFRALKRWQSAGSPGPAKTPVADRRSP
jgi:Zn-dependent peptidase ImmA (M78 family)